MISARAFNVSALGSTLISVTLATSCFSAQRQGVKEGAEPKQPARPGRIPERHYIATGSISAMVLVPAVCEELKISPEQRKQIMEAKRQAVSFQEAQQINRSLRNAGSHRERAEASGDPHQLARAEEELAVAANRQAKATELRDQAVRSLLTPAQNKRLFQIILRQEGIRAVTRRDVAEIVGVTEEQVVQIQQILTERETKIKAWRASSDHDPAARARAAQVERVARKTRDQEPITDADRQVMAEFNKRGNAKDEELNRFEVSIDDRLTRILTRSQQRRLTSLLGPDFDLGRLTRKAQPKPESKPGNRGDSANGKDEKQENPELENPSAESQEEVPERGECDGANSAG